MTRISRFAIPFAAAVALLGSATVVRAQSATLAWDANTEPDVSGYRLYYGTKSHTYTKTVDVGKVTTYKVTGLDQSLNYFFALQAYNSAGLSSGLSAEVELPAPVPPGTTVIQSLRSSSAYPLLLGKTVTWTAAATSKRGPVEYQFWMYSGGSWNMVQDYSRLASFTWTPGWGDRGTHIVQVWARTVGSTATYEAWVGTPSFAVNAQPLKLSASSDFPVPPGQPVKWTADAAGIPAGTTLEYQFWVYRKSKGTWTSFRAYGTSHTATWTPSASDTYAIQVWAREVGSSATYDIYASSPTFQVKKSPLVVKSLMADTTLPTATGTTITWTALASGGSAGPLEYAFWRYRVGGSWTKVQDYSTSNTYSWTPTWGDDGKYGLQVWVRSSGSTANYDGWKGTPLFDITPATVQLTTNTLFPAAPGTHITWNASVSDTSVAMEYSFWLYSQNSGTWSNVQPYSSDSSLTWTPSANGIYGVQVWVRRVGVTANYDAWRGTSLFEISQTTPEIVQLVSDVQIPTTAGTDVTWTALGRGGSAGPLQYEFWVYDGSSWSIGQAYSSKNTFVWTPPSPGTYALQVWVRSAGAVVNYENWRGVGPFQVK